jgi:glycosyltransferase involved in cell wall biosynthesis
VRICHISNLYPPDVLGGAELVVSHLARGLRDAGHDVTVVTTTRRHQAGEDEVDRIPVHRVPTANLYWAGDAPRRSRVLKPLWHLLDLWNPVMYARLRRTLRTLRVDLVHTHNLGGFSASAWSAAAAEGLPIVHTLHDHALTCVRAIRMTRAGRVCERQCLDCAVRGTWLRRLSRSVSGVSAPSRFVLARHLELGFFPGARANVVPWGLPPHAACMPSPASPPHPGAGGRRGPVRFLYIGGLVPHKGIGVVLDAFRRVAHLEVRLDIAGAGVLAEACARAAREDPRIRFHGYVRGDEKHELFASSDVVLLPSLCWEVVGLVILEALGHGVPVIASRTGGIPEFVDEGQTGFFVDPGDARALGERVARIAADPGLLDPMRKACLARSGALTLKRTVEELVEVYEAARLRRPCPSPAR